MHICSQEAGQVVWYSYVFQNFPQFIVIHTVKDFGIAPIDGVKKYQSSYYAKPHIQNKKLPPHTQTSYFAVFCDFFPL